MAQGNQYFLGVDGGATRCRARLRAASGAMLAQTSGPAANIYVDYSGALAAVRSAITRTLDEAGMSPPASGSIAVGVGLAGLSTGAEASRIAGDLGAVGGVVSVHAANDALTACLGAHRGADGGIVIAGTGSAGLARIGGRPNVVGGRGFLLGDDGSAARIGADAVRAALRAFDGLGPSSPLTRSVMGRFADDAEVAMQWALTARPSDYGVFAPLVIEAAAAGDSIGGPIIEAAALALGALTRAVQRLGVERIALVGGLAPAIRPRLPAGLAALLREPLFDATDGAILLAGGALPDPANSGEGS